MKSNLPRPKPSSSPSLPARGGEAAPVEEDALVVLPARVVEGVGERPALPQQPLAHPRDQLARLDRLVPGTPVWGFVMIFTSGRSHWSISTEMRFILCGTC